MLESKYLDFVSNYRSPQRFSKILFILVLTAYKGKSKGKKISQQDKQRVAIGETVTYMRIYDGGGQQYY